MFENDERFKAVERARDREDLFDNYMVELERKVKVFCFYTKIVDMLLYMHLCM